MGITYFVVTCKISALERLETSYYIVNEW